MAYAKIFDYLSLLALLFLSFGIMEQWWHVYKTRSVKDIVVSEVIIRLVVTLVLLVKLLIVGDRYLIAGQAVFLVVIILYTFTLEYVRFNRKRSK